MISSAAIGSKVTCTNGSAGRVTALVVDPGSQSLTHIAVVEESLTHGEERLVPISLVVQSTREEIKLSCTTDDVLKMEPFTRTRFLEETYGEEGYAYTRPYMVTYDSMTMTPDMGYVTVQDRLVPQGSVAVQRGMMVEALDGYVGQVGELLIDPKSGQVTHFLLMKGHGAGKKEVAIQLSSIDRMEDEVIHLNIAKAKLEELPSLPVKRTWNEVVATDIELMVWVYGNEPQADQALEKVHELAKQYKLEIFNATVLKKDKKGEVHIHEQKKMPSKRKITVGVALGGLAGLLIGPVALVAGAIAGGVAGKKSARKVEVGFSQDKLRKLDQSLAPGGSALLLVAEHRWFNTLELSLADTGGQLIHERLADVTYDELVEKLSAAQKES
jgi:uncharacterized membrane protein/sporulation protein YlmC with PRC-barrel domain